MIIGLDARTIFSPAPRGTGRNLFDAYQIIPRLRPDWRFILYHERPAHGSPLAEHGERNTVWAGNLRTRRLRMPGARFDAWLQLRLPWAARCDGVDLLHVPANAAPIWCPVPFVATVHDLIPLRIRGEADAGASDQFRKQVARAVRGAAHLITPSRATRDELCAEFGFSADRVTVIPWAPDQRIRDAPDDPAGREALRARYQLTRPWLLNFSGNSRRKNAHGLLRALGRLPAEARRRYLTVIVGCNSREQRAELATLAEDLSVADDCRILGFVPHEDLPGLLRGARAVLMPSLCEGFGLPILDAFAAGVPVLTSRCSSMPEVAGDAAIYCDATLPGSIADGIFQILHDETAADLVRRGYERVREFTWERTAGAMCAVYERCVEAVSHPASREVPSCR